jgi:hypothetical protein
MSIDVLRVMMLLIYDNNVVYTLAFVRTNMFQSRFWWKTWGNALKRRAHDSMRMTQYPRAWEASKKGKNL